jgi:hypothetical protein
VVAAAGFVRSKISVGGGSIPFFGVCPFTHYSSKLSPLALPTSPLPLLLLFAIARYPNCGTAG